MSSLGPHSEEEISTSNLVSQEDLAEARDTWTQSMRLMRHALQEVYCPLMDMPGIHSEAPVRASLQQIAVELVRLAEAAEQLFAYVYDLYRASLSPPVSISLGTKALELIDSCIAVIQNSARVVHSACRDNALPCALFSPWNPFPTLYQYFYAVLPATVALWKELARFTDVCAALDRLLPAIRILRSVVQQAVDERDARFVENRDMMKVFFKEACGTVDSFGCMGLGTSARNLWGYSKFPGVLTESLHAQKPPRRLYSWGDSPSAHP
ncbi:hypothetical protein FB45DRAFT_1031687 [Roridomyces roridus]|uniref:Uncharacterized protein n=1 Tax=Roridomyces roridus TaxID=1738132 RepID=A0AAD7BKX9_9AGAR|nr:hypothetical protein FB45DRAFT_490795 [Roridomyces roridus]KAJ7623784.1 hypothetical protein FB45DRAFT_1031687 [Roridomyces roridus]